MAARVDHLVIGSYLAIHERSVLDWIQFLISRGSQNRNGYYLLAVVYLRHQTVHIKWGSGDPISAGAHGRDLSETSGERYRETQSRDWRVILRQRHAAKLLLLIIKLVFLYFFSTAAANQKRLALIK
jgi:hypothetical protein